MLGTSLLAACDLQPAKPTDAYQIVYREAGSNNLVSVAYTELSGWSKETVPIGLNMASDTSPGVAFFNNQLHVFYRAAGNGELVNTYWTPGVGWATRNVPIGPKVAGDVSATAYAGALHIIYRSTAGELVNTRLTLPGTWESQLVNVGEPLASNASPDVTAWGDELHIAYRSAANHVINTTYDPTAGWSSQAVAVQVAPAGDVTTVGFGDSFHLAYRAAGTNDLRDVVYTAAEGWREGSVGVGLDMAGDASPDLAVYGNEIHVAYRAAQGGIVNTWWHPTDGWHSNTVPNVSPAGDPSAVTFVTTPPELPPSDDCGPVAAGPPIYSAESSAVMQSVNGITVHQCLAPELGQLLNDAAASGIALGGWGYRTPERQIELRRQNCGTSDYAIYQMPSSQCSPPTARPGTSMHERGVAIDFTVNGSTIRSGSAAFNWLSSHAASYGLRNFPQESWHWSVTGG